MLKEDILKYFIENKKKATLNELALFFDVSRNACWKAINKLIEEGYAFDNDKKHGYEFLINNKLNAVAINNVSNRFKCIEVMDSVDSTNTYLKCLNNKVSDIVVVSDEQTAGRGRRGKSFSSLKGYGAYFTLYLKDSLDVNDVGFLTICAAVAIRRCLKDKYEIESDVKWLNDIYYNSKKLCGILTEVSICAEEGSVNEIYVGIGINSKKTHEEISDFATSLEEITSNAVDRNELIGNILNYFNIVYSECFIEDNKKNVLEEYISYQFIIGMEVEVHLRNEIFKAIVHSINDKAELVVKVDTKLITLNTGTIVLKGGENEN